MSRVAVNLMSHVGEATETEVEADDGCFLLELMGYTFGRSPLSNRPDSFFFEATIASLMTCGNFFLSGGIA